MTTINIDPLLVGGERQTLLEEGLLIEADSVVSWHANFLLLNIFKVPEPLMTFNESGEQAEANAMLDLMRFFLISGLAEKKIDSSQNVQLIVASKKLVRNASWLLSGKQPDRRTHLRMSRLVRKAMMFLAKQAVE